MKLIEITKIIHQESPGFNFKDFEVGEQIGTAENIPIMKLIPKNNSDLEGYALYKDDKIIGCILGRRETIRGELFVIQRTYIIPSERNKGHITSLYKALYSKYKLKLVSDVEQSPETISVWKKLMKELPVKVLDVKKKKILDLKDVPKNQLYDKELGLRLILEQIDSRCLMFLSIPERSELLTDNIIYTHPLNEGKYI
jgi:hypothetical protein